MKVKEMMMDQFDLEEQEQQAYYQELHQQTYELLQKVEPHITAEELSLLCYHCGFSINDFIGQ